MRRGHRKRQNASLNHGEHHEKAYRLDYFPRVYGRRRGAIRHLHDCRYIDHMLGWVQRYTGGGYDGLLAVAVPSAADLFAADIDAEPGYLLYRRRFHDLQLKIAKATCV